jgi:molybdopterin-containing oxidoreductase family iron-sulfur binding subunit
MELEMRRRDMLKLAALSASIAACKRLPVRHALPYLVPPEELTPGVPVHYASTCTACPAACGLVASVRDGRPVKLEGHPQHPLSRGGLCALGQGDLRALYDAGRLQGPTLGGQKATWDELDALVVRRLAEVRASGKRVAVLSPTLTSPTAHRAITSFLAAFDGTLVEADPDPESGSAQLEAYERLDGTALLPALEIERADLLVVLGADLLGTGVDPVGHTAAYAARRRAAEQGRAFRHVQLEGSLSLTGAAADERVMATTAERRLAALWLLRRVAEAVGGAAAGEIGAALQGLPDPGALAEPTTRLAAALVAARGHGLVVSGANDLAEQLAVALANRVLGNEGATLDLARPSLVRRGRDRELAALVEGLERRSIGALFVLGLDPVDQLPGGEALRGALAALPLAVAISERPTATAAACHAVAAAHHGLECWGDAMPRAGVVTLAQPMVRPIFGTRHPIEGFLRWSGAAVADYRLHLKDAWRQAAEAADFEWLWTRAVAEGLAPASVASAFAPPGPSAGARARNAPGHAASALRDAVAGAPAAPAGDALEVELLAEVGLRDGHRAHVPWLRELPDPLTRVAWTACVRVAPQRARALGVRDGDELAVRVGESEVSLPVRVMPGQHPAVLGLPIGYGRADGGDLPARNAFRLSAWTGGRLVRRGLAAAAQRTGGFEALPLVQPQATTAGREVVHQLASCAEAVPHESHDRARDLWPNVEKRSPQWHMVIDLDACTGCSACVIACQAENNVAVVGPDEMRRHRDMHWLRIDRYFSGDPEQPEVLFEPMLCAQCGHAPCETVCPVAATVHSEDGLNQQVYNRCVGTRYCANNCPYKVRRFNWFDNEPRMGGPLERMVLNPDVVVRSRGVMEKCTFCVQRIQLARLSARAEARDVGDVKTACQQSCPAQAIAFGDGHDPQGEIAALRGKPRAFQVLAELGIEPSVTYLARVRAREGGAKSGGGEHA